MSSPLDRFFYPRSIAVAGASDDSTRIGGRTIWNLKAGKFAGPVYPINPNRPTVQGLTAYKSLTDVPGDIDLLVVALPGELVLPAIEAAAVKGVKAAVIFSAGFSEAGEEGVARQRRLVEIAQASDMRIIGPNCLGVYNSANGAWASFTAVFQPRAEGPAVGMISQSGGSAAHIIKLAQLRGLAIGKFITTGNEADIGFGEGLKALAEDPEVAVIVAYIEGVRDPENFIAGLGAARRNRKPVITLKVGRTAAGAEAAASHTASLAGEDSVYDAIFRSYGVHRAGSTEELLDIAYAASVVGAKLPKGNRFCTVTISGGMGAQIADAAADAGLTMEQLSEAGQARLKALCPPGSPRNPIDITAQLSTDPHLLAASMRVALEEKHFDLIFGFFGIYAGVPALNDVILEDLARLKKDFPEALLGVGVVCGPEVAKKYEAAGYLVFEEPARAVRAMAALRGFAERFEQQSGAAAVFDLPKLDIAARYNERDAKALLAALGVQSPAESTAITPEAAGKIAAGFKFPVALKIVSADILHKSDVGGVKLNLGSAATVEDAARIMQAEVARHLPGARQEGFLISEMVGPGVELIIGTRRDPLFGPLIMVGLGGVTAELFKDVAVALAPVSEFEAEKMLRRLTSFPLLDGWRGAPKADLAAARRAISAISCLAAAEPRISLIEVNPLRIMTNGALALDAVIETA
jgi:acyl-CoA synthetase (NDP forming)